MSVSPASQSEDSLAGAAVGGVAWQGLSFISGKAMVLLSTVVLARLLTPADFGLVGLALVFVTYADVITDLGVTQALVYLPAGRHRNDAALLVSVLVSLTFVLLALAAAPLAARFFGEPQVTSMMRLLSLSLLLRGLGQVPDALLRKELRFRPRLYADFFRAGGQGLISIGLAAAGFGPWAIVFGYLAGSAVWTVLVWGLVEYRPGRDFWPIRPEAIVSLLAYGAPAAGTSLLLVLVFNVDYLIVGRLLGARALGFYTLGFRIPELVIINVFNVLSAVAFPLYSLARENRGRLLRGYLFGLKLQAVFGVAAGVGLAMLAPMLVHVVFGRRWTATIVPLEALALYAAFRSVGMGPNDVFRGIGRPGLLLWLSLARLAMLIPALLIASRAGIDGVSWAQAAVALPLAFFMQAVAARALGLPLRRVAEALGPAAGAGLAAAVAVGAVRLWMPGPEAGRLAAGLLAGAAATILSLAVVDRHFLREATAMIRSRKASLRASRLAGA